MSSNVVRIRQGLLKGCIGFDINGDQFFKFLGIPYAKPPVGNLRFRAPQPPEPWQGVKDATKEGNSCISLRMITREVIGSDDCLYLNVYTKNLPSDTNKKPNLKPVMVFIHGGGFTAGSGDTDLYGPEYLISMDIVLVTINYRLGILGFLSLEDTSLGVPGNAGLKDQTMALKWVQENISMFNGDPKNVTIFGESAGGASVHHQMLSPTAKGLFHKAILQSGCALNPWAWGQRNALDITKSLGKSANSEKEALDVLRNATSKEILKAQKMLESSSLNPSVTRPFGPIIEKDNETAFITQSPSQIILSGNYNHVPMVIGFNSREGLLMEMVKAYGGSYSSLEDCIPWIFDIKKNSKRYIQTLEEMKNLYMKNEDGIFDVFSDTAFVLGIVDSVEKHLCSTKYPIFMYQLSRDTTISTLKQVLGIKYAGVCHGDDLSYLFKSLMAEKSVDRDSVEMKTIELFINLWTNFAKYGNPTPLPENGVTWEPACKSGNLNYLDIGEELKMKVNPFPERISFWKEVVSIEKLNNKL